MKLRARERLPSEKKTENKKPSKTAYRCALAGAAAAVSMAFSPMLDGVTKAQDAGPDLPDIVYNQGRPAAESQPDAQPPPSQPARDNVNTINNAAEEPDFGVPEDYYDHALGDEYNVDKAGRKRPITVDHPWSLGGDVRSNVAGSAVSATAGYTAKESRYLQPTDVSLRAGNIWFGELEAPFFRLFVKPGLKLWRLKLNYYGSLAFLGNMPSYLYTSHSLGFGYSQPIGKDMRLRMGIVGGGALSYDKWDDIYFNFVPGLSFQYDRYLAYGMTSFYYAAPDEIKTPFIAHYRPYFQNVEFGVQADVGDGYAVRLFDEYGPIKNMVAARLTKSLEFGQDMAGDIGASLGATKWAGIFGGRWDPAVMIDLTMVVGGRYLKSTNTGRYEHLQSGGIDFAETHFPSEDNLGPYGFGRSGNPSCAALQC